MSAQNFSFMLAAQGEIDLFELRQGDILERTPELAAAIGKAHQYYATEAGYDYFLVLTPTCELVLREGRPSSHYISLAAIRPADVLVDRHLVKWKQSIKAPGVFCSKSRRGQAEQFVERLLHNTEPGYLFLPSEMFSDGVDRCAFLRLSVALRASEHYQACVNSKRMQLAVDFSAKVGFLTADLYGQIATQALEEQENVNAAEVIATYKERMLDRDGVYWLTPQGLKVLKAKIQQHKADNNNEPIAPCAVKTLVNSVEGDQRLIADRVFALLEAQDVGNEQDRILLRNSIAGDQYIGQFLR